MSDLTHSIEAEYRRVAEFVATRQCDLRGHFLNMTRQFELGLWREYLAVIEAIPICLRGKTFVDFGCKYGHLVPMLSVLGCKEIIGLDALPEYVSVGGAVFGKIYPASQILNTGQGYIPLQPESADVVLMNEVISHVNPSFLDRVWSEVARILRPGGLVFISDGNNALNSINRQTLPDLYAKWENGPVGAHTDRDIVDAPFLDIRRQIIRGRHQNLSAETVEMVAQNTSGLFDQFFIHTVDHYVQTGELVRRPYKAGTCPTHPIGGFVMERAFHPRVLGQTLAEYGFRAEPIVPGSRTMRRVRPGAVGFVRDYISWLKARWWGALVVRFDGGRSRGFQIAATKL